MTNPITIYGIDFTSNPKSGKPIVGIECRLTGDSLEIGESPWRLFRTFGEFENFLATPPAEGQWIAAIDFPFSQSLRFIENIGWPCRWADYVGQRVKPLSRQSWRDVLDGYKSHRPYGDKEHLRETDKLAGSVSPQKHYGVPVALMFHEGAPRLLDAGVTIPGFQDGDPKRIAVEAYPGVAVSNLVAPKPSYKTDVKAKQSRAHRENRQLILARLVNGGSRAIYGVQVQGAGRHGILIKDPTGDHLDALLCAVQAAWASRNGPPNYGLPSPICPTEGWIADPMPGQDR